MAEYLCTLTWTQITCCHKGCGLTFVVTASWEAARRKDHQWWFCPNGHTQHFSADNEEEKQRRRAEQAEQRVERFRQEADQQRALKLHQERRASTFKGHCTRIRRKVSIGKCPCCDDTTFKNLRRHMLKHHPAWEPDAEVVMPAVAKP